MTASTDVERLRAMISLPRSVVSARWVLGVLGTGGDLDIGPTDTRLVALLRFLPATSLDEQFPRVPDASAASIPLAYAREVLRPEALASLPSVAGDVVLPGPFRAAEAMSRMPHRVKFAAEVDGALLVHALSY